MKPWIKTFLSQLFGLSVPAPRTIDRRVRPLVELLEDRLVPAVMPQTFIVTTALDNVVHSGMSLRDAVNAANTDGNASVVDIIKFDASLTGKTIKLNAGLGELPINESLSIKGLGAGNLSIDGGTTVGGEGGVRLFDIFHTTAGAGPSIRVTITDLKLTNGRSTIDSPDGGNGGAILVQGETVFGDSLTVQRCLFTNNASGDSGGAIALKDTYDDPFDDSPTFNDCNLVVQDCTFFKNSTGGEGGAINFGSSAFLTIDRCSFLQNTSSQHGFGSRGGALVLPEGGSGIISNTTFAGNIAGGEGGGAIATHGDGDLTLNNCTLVGNSTAHGDGGAILNIDGDVTLRNCTLSQNKALQGHGGGVVTETEDQDFADTIILNTIVEGNRDSAGANDLYRFSGFFDVQSSLIQTPGTAINGTNSNNIFFVSANLEPLQYNGGPQQYIDGVLVGLFTMRPKRGSPALRAGSTALLHGLSVDQRGLQRTYGNTVDIGAVEATLDYRRGW